MHIRRLGAVMGTAAVILAACSTTPGAAPGGSTAAGGDCTVGMSWNNYQEERWAKADEPAIKGALEAAGASYISADAGSSAEQQLADVENLISQGADALIILAQDGEAILPAVQSAADQGIPVIGYDRLIEDEEAFYITFDNVEVGRMEAREIFAEVPTGNYIIIKGNEADPNATFLRNGYEEVIGDAVDAGDIEIVGETFTDNWDPEIAQDHTEQFLTQADNDVQAVLSENDGMAGGVIAALEAQGLAGEVPVSGQDGDAAALNRVALGTQTVSVWKDAFALGQAAGAIAVQLAQGTAPTDVTLPEDLPEHAAPADGAGVTQFETPGGNTVNAVILTPLPIKQDNLNVVIDAGWITQEEVCQGVEAGSVDVCE
jgi:D-xylose transport system substrate-binding protein